MSSGRDPFGERRGNVPNGSTRYTGTVPTPFDDARWDTFGLLKEAFLALDERFAEVVASTVTIERSVVDLLIRVARSPNATARPTDLARDLALVPSHITRCLDEAERQRLIRRTANPHDRRSTLIQIAPAGKKLLAKIEAPMTEVRDQLIHHHLAAADIAILEDTLRQLRDRAQHVDPLPTP